MATFESMTIANPLAYTRGGDTYNVVDSWRGNAEYNKRMRARAKLAQCDWEGCEIEVNRQY